MHRGYDAAGYFLLPVDETKPKIFKAAGLATDIFKKKFIGKNKLPVSRVFGAHTRDPSTSKHASVEFNENNHPIYWDGVWVTHNGTLSNDKEIKAWYEANTKKRIPEVDSVAIPMVLSETTPDSPEDIAEVLGALEGSFAIHAIWRDFPGVSLFAKGVGKPLIYARHESGAFVYGSEEDSIWSQIFKMDLNPNDESWEWRELKNNVMLIVKDGVITNWGNFKSFQPASKEAAIQRILPKEKKRQDEIVVYETTSQWDFAKKAAFHSALEADDYEVIYKRSDTVSLENMYPARSDAAWYSVFSEADIVYKIKENYHGFFGKIEVVLNSSRTVFDVFNHGVFDNKDRWATVEPENPKLLGAALPLEKFVQFQTQEPSHIPTKQESYWFEMELYSSMYAQYKMGGFVTSESSCDITPSTNVVEKRDDDEFSLMHPNMIIDWYNVYTDVFHHVDDDTLVFLVNAECPDHKQQFKIHSNPHECRTLLVSSAFTYACVGSVDIYIGVSADLLVEYKMNTPHCGVKTGTFAHRATCDWKTTEYVEVYHNTYKFKIMTEETCSVCTSRRKLIRLPLWLRELEHTERISYDIWNYWSRDHVDYSNVNLGEDPLPLLGVLEAQDVD